MLPCNPPPSTFMFIPSTASPRWLLRPGPGRKDPLMSSTCHRKLSAPVHDFPRGRRRGSYMSTAKSKNSSKPLFFSKLALSISVAISLSPTLVAAQNLSHDTDVVSVSNSTVAEQFRKIEKIMTPSFARKHPISAMNAPVSRQIIESEQGLEPESDSRYHPGEVEHVDNVSETRPLDNVTSEIISSTTNDLNSSSSVTIDPVTTPPSLATASNQSQHESLGEKVAKRLRTVGVPDAMIVFTLSALPILELRAGIPAGFLLGLPARDTFLLSVCGNLFPIIPFILLLRFKWVQSLSGRILGRARTLAQTIGNAQSRAVALALFVGVPLPGTGAWTGSLVALVLGMPVSSTIASLSAGVLMAATIMTALCALGWIGASIAAGALGTMGVLAIVRACTTIPKKEPQTTDGSSKSSSS